MTETRFIAKDQPGSPAIRRVRRGISWSGVSRAIGVGLYALAFVLILLTAWAAYRNVELSGWGSDAAAWIQATGSIAAIAGATWLAQTDSRRARRERRRQNVEAAWYARFVISQAQLESYIIASELVNRSSPVDSDDIRKWRSQTLTATMGLSALIARVDNIHPLVTQSIANAKMLMDELLLDLTTLSMELEQKREPSEPVIGRIVSPHRALLAVLDQFDSRMRGVELALDEGGDALPIDRWNTWRS